MQRSVQNERAPLGARGPRIVVGSVACTNAFRRNSRFSVSWSCLGSLDGQVAQRARGRTGAPFARSSSYPVYFATSSPTADGAVANPSQLIRSLGPEIHGHQVTEDTQAAQAAEGTEDDGPQVRVVASLAPGRRAAGVRLGLRYLRTGRGCANQAKLGDARRVHATDRLSQRATWPHRRLRRSAGVRRRRRPP